MKRLFIFALFVLLPLMAFSAVIVVDGNVRNPSATRTLQAAHNAATAGDTIYVVGCYQNYDGCTSTKRLTWVGPGYFLSANPETQANQSEARINGFNLSTGSDSSVVTGLTFVNTFAINSNVILVKRCRTNGGQISVSNCRDIFILQCFIGDQIYLATTQSVEIYNCIFANGNYNIGYQNGLVMGTVVGNCFFDISGGYGTNFFNTTFFNCFFRLGGQTATFFGYPNSQFDHCFFTGTSLTLPAGTGNRNNLVFDSCYTMSGSSDYYYSKLRTNSPCYYAGRDSMDIGVSSGFYPYVLSGIPSFPTITYLFAPATVPSSTGLPVNFRAKGRN